MDQFESDKGYILCAIKAHHGFIINSHWSLRDPNIFYTLSEDQTCKQWDIEKIQGTMDMTKKKSKNKKKDKRKGNRKNK